MTAAGTEHRGRAATIIGFAAVLSALSALFPGSVVSAPSASMRFETIDVIIDADAPLAAYQIELKVVAGNSTIVGIEGGEAPFDGPPFYDPEALAKGRIIIAAFDVARALSPGRHRVATLHMHTTGGESRFRTVLQAAADADGNRIAPTIEHRVRKDIVR